MDQSTTEILQKAKEHYEAKNRDALNFAIGGSIVGGITWATLGIMLGLSGHASRWLILIIVLCAAIQPILSGFLYRFYRRIKPRGGGRSPTPIELALAELEKNAVGKKKTIDARHAENRELRQDVLNWWEEHKAELGGNKNEAARQMAGKIVPIPYGTVRDYLKKV